MCENSGDVVFLCLEVSARAQGDVVVHEHSHYEYMLAHLLRVGKQLACSCSTFPFIHLLLL